MRFPSSVLQGPIEGADATLHRFLTKLKRIYQRHELKAEQREAWRRLGDRVALLLAAEGHENFIAARFARNA